MTSGFSDPIIGAGGALVYPSIHSPDYNPLAGTGWTINKDGSATFYSVSIPGFAGGVKATFSATEPPSPNVGDLWYNTGNGLQLSQWNGTSWVLYQIGTNAIAGGAVTASLVAPGDTTNPNPYFAGGDTSNWFAFNGGFLGAVQTTGGFSYPWAGEITAAPASSFPGISGPSFPANAGDPAQINGWFNANADVFFSVAYYNSSGGFLSNTSTTITADPGVWQYAALVGTVPAGAVSAGISVGFNSGSTTGTESAQCTGLTVLTKVAGGLIEAGTVTAAQIMAGTITASLIAANTITAAQLDATDVIANVIDGATITGNTINGAVFNGTNWIENALGSFFYSGTPANGNLVVSITASQGTDGFGNTFYSGLTIYGPSGAAIGLNPGSGGTNVSIIMIPGVTPSPQSGCAVLFANNSGELIVIDGTDAATYATQRRSLVLGSNSGSLTSLANIFQSSVGVRTYRIHAQLYVNATSGAQFTCAFALPGGTGTGELGYTISRATTFVGAVAGTANASVGVAVSLGTASGYVVQLDGTCTPAGSGTFSFQAGSLTGTGLVVAAGSLIDIMPV